MVYSYNTSCISRYSSSSEFRYEVIIVYNVVFLKYYGLRTSSYNYIQSQKQVSDSMIFPITYICTWTHVYTYCDSDKREEND